MSPPRPLPARPHRPPELAGWARSQDRVLAMPARRLLLLLLALLLPGPGVSDLGSWGGGHLGACRGPSRECGQAARGPGRLSRGCGQA